MDRGELDAQVGVTCVTKVNKTTSVPGIRSEWSAKCVLPAGSCDNADGTLCYNSSFAARNMAVDDSQLDVAAGVTCVNKVSKTNSVPGIRSEWRSAKCVPPAGSCDNTDGALCYKETSSFAARNMEMDKCESDAEVEFSCVNTVNKTIGVPNMERERCKSVLPVFSSDDIEVDLCCNVMCSIAAPEAELDKKVLCSVEVQELLCLVDESCSLYASIASVHREINHPVGVFNGVAVTSNVNISPLRGVLEWLCCYVLCSIAAPEADSDEKVLCSVEVQEWLCLVDESCSLYASIASVRREINHPVGVFNGVAVTSNVNISPLRGVLEWLCCYVLCLIAAPEVELGQDKEEVQELLCLVDEMCSLYASIASVRPDVNLSSYVLCSIDVCETELDLVVVDVNCVRDVVISCAESRATVICVLGRIACVNCVRDVVISCAESRATVICVPGIFDLVNCVRDVVISCDESRAIVFCVPGIFDLVNCVRAVVISCDESRATVICAVVISCDELRATVICVPGKFCFVKCVREVAISGVELSITVFCVPEKNNWIKCVSVVALLGDELGTTVMCLHKVLNKVECVREVEMSCVDLTTTDVCVPKYKELWGDSERQIERDNGTEKFLVCADYCLIGVAAEASWSKREGIETVSVSAVEWMPQCAVGDTVGYVKVLPVWAKGSDVSGVKSGERIECIKSSSRGFKVSAAKFRVKVKKKINRTLLLMLSLCAKCYSILSLTVAMFVLMGSVGFARVLIYDHGYVINGNGIVSVTQLMSGLRNV